MLRIFFHLLSVFSSSKLFLPFEIFSSCCCMNSLPSAFYIHLLLLGLISLPAVRSVCNCCPVFCFYMFSSARVLKHLQCIFFLQSERPCFIPILTLPILCYTICSSVCQSHCCYLVPVSDLRWQEVASYCINT